MDFQFKRQRVDKISKDQILNELENVAKQFDYTQFTGKDFNKNSTMSSTTATNMFGNWENVLENLKLKLKEKNIALKTRERAKKKVFYSNKELFKEMERIWTKVGHRPSRYEWNVCEPKISYATYSHRFGTWINACLKFIENKMGGEVTVDQNKKSFEGNKELTKEKIIYKQEESRRIPAGLRLKVLDRDNFRCQFCGRSPATKLGVQLHIDHIYPFSRGGKSILENLQTLCRDCNLGKSDRQLLNMPKQNHE